MKKTMPKTAVFLFLSVFICIGLYFLLSGIFPIEVEIKHFNNTATAQIHRKSMLPPFNNINIMIPHLKQAIIASSRSSKGTTTYRVEFESYDGKTVPVTTYYSSGYLSKERLKNLINESIRKEIDFKYVIRQTFMIFFGFFFMLIPSVMLLIFLKQDNTKQKPKTNPSVSVEEEKYTKINDLIIK